MFAPISQTLFRHFAPIIAAILVTIAAALPTPVFAVDGRTAVGICIDSTANGSRCAWSVNDKGEIDICNASGCVYCPSATDQCSVARRRPRPTRPMPAGTTVRTPVGTVEVSRSPASGSILAARCRPGSFLCPTRGCIKVNTECNPLK